MERNDKRIMLLKLYHKLQSIYMLNMKAAQLYKSYIFPSTFLSLKKVLFIYLTLKEIDSQKKIEHIN